jgi:hypothetical protein
MVRHNHSISFRSLFFQFAQAIRTLRRIPIYSAVIFAFWIVPGESSADAPSFQIRKVIFSDQQFFWPQLESLPSLPGLHDPGQNANPKHLTPDSNPPRLAVLPIRITNYRESIPCDSCHRLSANGMEFYLENYLKDKLAHRFPKAVVTLAAPHLSLLETQKLDLMGYLDSLELPWTKWFNEPKGEFEAEAEAETFIYRPRDFMTSNQAKRRMDRIGGLLNQDYLLLPTQVAIEVKPVISNGHTGGLKLRFALVFWNVTKGAPEWAFKIFGETKFMDLDKSLDASLDKALGSAWDQLPGEFKAKVESEPH